MKLNQTLKLKQDLEAAMREAEKQTERSALEIELRKVYMGLVNLKTVSNQEFSCRDSRLLIKPSSNNSETKQIAQEYCRCTRLEAMPG